MNSLLPIKRANTIILDGRAGKEIKDNLKKLNLNIILTPKCLEVQNPISHHPDIHLHPINYNTIVIAPNVFDYYSNIFKNSNIKLIKGNRKLGYDYPKDIPYNIARVGNYAIHNKKYTDESILYLLNNQGIEFINVKQGYSKCSVAIVDENSIITSDRTIYEKTIKKNMDVLLIEKGYIKLEGYNYGFIGGAMGNIDKNNILIAGELKTHIDGDRILDFIKKRNINIIELKKGEIEDLGSMIPIFMK